MVISLLNHIGNIRIFEALIGLKSLAIKGAAAQSRRNLDSKAGFRGANNAPLNLGYSALVSDNSLGL